MCWLIEQGKKYREAFSLKYFYEDKRSSCFFSHLADDCFLAVSEDTRLIVGKKAVEEYFSVDQDSLKRAYPYATVSVVESGKDILLLIKKEPDTDGSLIRFQINDDGLVSRIDSLAERDHPYRTIEKYVNLIPEKETEKGMEENKSISAVISDLYYDEMHLFFDMIEYGPFDPWDDQHIISDYWLEILAAWRSFYEAENYDAVYQKQMARKAGDEKKYPKHVEWFSGLLKTVWEKKEYGWKMLEGLEEWVNRYKDEYEWMNLI